MTPSDVHVLFIRDYFIMSYLAVTGVVQVSVSMGGLRGLYLIPSVWLTRVLGVALVTVGIAWFIFAPAWTPGPWGGVPANGAVVGFEGERVAWGKAGLADLPRARNINDVNGGLSGNSQSMWFAFGAFAAIVSTYAVTSLGNLRLRRPSGEPQDGVEALKESSFLRALGRSLRYWRANWGPELGLLFRARRATGKDRAT